MLLSFVSYDDNESRASYKTGVWLFHLRYGVRALKKSRDSILYEESTLLNKTYEITVIVKDSIFVDRVFLLLHLLVQLRPGTLPGHICQYYLAA